MIKVPDKFDVRFIDASRLSTMARCETKFLFSCLYGFVHPDAGMIPLDYGTVMHRVHPHMFSGQTAKAIETFNDLWKDYDYGEEDPKRNTALTIARIMNFVNNHTPENCPYEIIHFPFSTPTKLISENEVPFLIDIGAIYPFCGRVDMVVHHKLLNSLFAYDFKTSSEISPRYFEGFWHSNQAVGYTIATEHLSGKKVEGIIYEAMRVSKTNMENQLGFVYVNETNKRTFIEEAKLTCARIEAANESGVWRQNTALCSSYAAFGFPCRTCEFKTLCDAPNWQDATKFYKRRKPFDPLDLDGEE